MRLTWVALASLSITAGCTPAFDTPFPLVVDAEWVFEVTDSASGAVSTKTQRVTAKTTLDGVEGDVYELETDKAGGGHTTSIQQDTVEALVRFREESVTAADAPDGSEVYQPAKVRVPKTLLTVGAKLTDSYTETDTDAAGVVTTVEKSEEWTLIAIETLTTPAGSFDSAFHFLRTGLGDKEFWFANDVGKLREESGAGTEVLTGFTIP